MKDRRDVIVEIVLRYVLGSIFGALFAGAGMTLLIELFSGFAPNAVHWGLACAAGGVYMGSKISSSPKESHREGV